METKAVIEEGLLDVGILPCNIRSSVSVPARNHKKLSATIREEMRTRPPVTFCVKFESFHTMSKLVKDNGDKYESHPFSASGYNWVQCLNLSSWLVLLVQPVPGSNLIVLLKFTMENSHLSGQETVPVCQDESSLQVSDFTSLLRQNSDEFLAEDIGNNEDYLQTEDVDALEANNQNQKKNMNFVLEWTLVLMSLHIKLIETLNMNLLTKLFINTQLRNRTVRFVKPYYNFQNLMETKAVIEEGLLDVGILPCNIRSSVSVPARNHKKLSATIREEMRTRPPVTFCVKFESFDTMSKLVKDNGDKYESHPFSAGGYNWLLGLAS
ncbi:hypothetical protein F2Q68_00035360 [Brassica cretica]|uniref:MATH domain-containing protein n=1 Tax=Brassica cretica TaxID=69181 RepID=A0A8S9H2N2_BRACR|nr:hypothetical protein F2Q68_00035360 [Brassica cretica]